jgi:dihydrolipoamide dehydrogenase
MNKHVHVAIVGAGHAGLNAIKEVRKTTDDYVLINGGGLGTTCARIGCMPSKVAVHLGEVLQERKHYQRYGIEGAEHIKLNQETALEHVRDLRDTFVDLVLANTTDEMEDELIEGYAELIDGHTLKVGDEQIRAESIVIATGASSFVPRNWRASFGEDILTAENLFEQERLPRSIAVIGLGPVGIEIGQALHRLGVEVTGIEAGETIARVQDPGINQAAIEILQREFPLWLGQPAQVERKGDGYLVRAGDREVLVERIFVAMGRRPATARLGFARLGIPTDALGVPEYDHETLRVGRLPIYIAGDAAGGIANLQRAAEQGRIAGHNACHPEPKRLAVKTPMSIVFSEPNIACVGMPWTELDPDGIAVAQIRFGPVGRAIIMGRNRGILRVYADPLTGRLLGGAMIGPRCEHLAHLLAWCVQSGMTVQEALSMPFYHPVIEEAFQDALLDLERRIGDTRAPARLLDNLFPWRQRAPASAV